MKICYEYRIQKTAYLPDGEKLVAIGTFEDHQREGDVCKMTVKLFPNVPEKLIDLLREMPQLIQMRELKLKADTVVLIPEGHDAKF